MPDRHLQAEYMALEKIWVCSPTNIVLLWAVGRGEIREKAEKTQNKDQLLNMNNNKGAL